MYIYIYISPSIYISICLSIGLSIYLWEAKTQAAKHLPELGSMLDAEEEFEEALGTLRTLSPLLLVDGERGAGKSCLINAWLAGQGVAEVADGGDAGCAADLPSAGPGDCLVAPAGPSKAARARATLPVGRPADRNGRPLVVRAPAGGRAGRRFLEGWPSLRSVGSSEASLRELSFDEWAIRDGKNCRRRYSQLPRAFLKPGI